MASSKLLLLTAVCCFIILTTFISSTQSASCCLIYSARPLRCRRLLDYTIQTNGASCDINAIIFHVPGRFVCADPRLEWTQRCMKCVDERKMDIQLKKGNAQNVTKDTNPHQA
ncbi:C-C motif chemokine 20b [Thalassophryne amazonica]|uniref:C-C motif chemokine 20b n=1 Tax=Thalassophryne amazonica TaxID=390379 RepID=UPI0014723942|nr:C-C motif chemokine 20b [Thalassophryne amazonica]